MKATCSAKCYRNPPTFCPPPWYSASQPENLYSPPIIEGPFGKAITIPLRLGKDSEEATSRKDSVYFANHTEPGTSWLHSTPYFLLTTKLPPTHFFPFPLLNLLALFHPLLFFSLLPLLLLLHFLPRF